MKRAKQKVTKRRKSRSAKSGAAKKQRAGAKPAASARKFRAAKRSKSVKTSRVAKPGAKRSRAGKTLAKSRAAQSAGATKKSRAAKSTTVAKRSRAATQHTAKRPAVAKTSRVTKLVESAENSAKPSHAAKLPHAKVGATKERKKPLASAPAPELTDEDFERMWKMVDRVRREARGNLTASIAAFRRELGALDDDGVLRIGAAFNRTMARAYHNLLWGGAYVLHGGCSDDTFWDFRAGLIALGRDVYEAALANPDTLADIDDIENLTLFEGFQYVPNQVAESRGLELNERQHLPKPAGDGFSDSELDTLFPKLTARFG